MDNVGVDPVPIYAALVSTLAFGVSFASMYLQHVRKSRKLYAIAEPFFNTWAKGYAQGVEVTIANGGNVGATITGMGFSYVLKEQQIGCKFHKPNPKILYDPKSLYLDPLKSTRIQVTFEEKIDPDYLKECPTDERNEEKTYFVKLILSISFVFSSGERFSRELAPAVPRFDSKGYLCGMHSSVDLIELRTMQPPSAKLDLYTKLLRYIAGRENSSKQNIKAI